MDWNELTRSRTLSVPDRLSVDLERLILDGKVKPGERFPSERELSELLEVSRVSIRQALRELETRGLIDRKRGRGTIVMPIAAAADHAGEVIGQVLDHLPAEGSQLANIMELRSILEPPIAGITAQRASQRDIAQLDELLTEMEGDVTSERYGELDRTFHQAIAQYTHNPLLAMLNEQISNLIAPSRDTALQTKSRRSGSSAAHRRIYQAIADANPERAEHEAREHVLTVRAEILRAERANSESSS